MPITPGPWIAIPTRVRWHGPRPLFEDGLWDILPANNLERLPICTVDHGNDQNAQVRKDAEDHARLIAAAPELLKALSELLDAWWLEFSHFFGDNAENRSEFEALPKVINARAVIQKAEGRP